MAAPEATARQDISDLTPAAGPRTANSGYRYRGTGKRQSPARQAESVRTLLRHYRQLIHFRSSSVRNVSAHLHQQIAQALTDGLKITDLAEATELSRHVIRRIGLSFQDLDPTGLSRQEHLMAISVLKGELADLEESKAAIERNQLELLAATRRKRLMDDYELASLSGLNQEHIPRMTWGVEWRNVLPA